MFSVAGPNGPVSIDLMDGDGRDGRAPAEPIATFTDVDNQQTIDVWPDGDGGIAITMPERGNDECGPVVYMSLEAAVDFAAAITGGAIRLAGDPA